jgi:hypothetical protein
MQGGGMSDAERADFFENKLRSFIAAVKEVPLIMFDVDFEQGAEREREKKLFCGNV